MQIVYGGYRHYLFFTFPPHLSPLSAILPDGEKVSDDAERLPGDETKRSGGCAAREVAGSPLTGGPSGAGEAPPLL